MIVAAGINVAVLFAIIAMMLILSGRADAVSDSGPKRVVSWGKVIIILPLGLLINSLILCGAIRMMQLRNRGLAITAAILALIAAPGNIIGLPMGIWALVVLSRREIMETFATVQDSMERPAPWS